MKLLICNILLICMFGSKASPNISHWGKYVYQDTLKWQGQEVFFDSELFLFEKDSTYAYTIQCKSDNIRKHKVSSYGKVKFNGDLFYLVDTSYKNTNIEFDVYEEHPKNICGVMLNGLTEEEQVEILGTHTKVNVLVPFNPSAAYQFGISTQISLKVNGQQDKMEWHTSDLKNNPMFRIYDRSQISYDEGEIDSIQVCIKQDITYTDFLNEGELVKSIINCSKAYHPFYKNRAVAYTIVLNRIPFMPYENLSYWQIQNDNNEIFIERSRIVDDTLFVRLKKVL